MRRFVYLINFLYNLLATSTKLIAKGRFLDNRNTVAWPCYFVRGLQIFGYGAEICLFFIPGTCTCNTGEVSFPLLDPLLQTGVHKYLHDNSLQHQPSCFTGTLSVPFISRLVYNLFICRTSTVFLLKAWLQISHLNFLLGNICMLLQRPIQQQQPILSYSCSLCSYPLIYILFPQTSIRHALLCKKSNPRIPSTFTSATTAWQHNFWVPSSMENDLLPCTIRSVPSAFRG